VRNLSVRLFEDNGRETGVEGELVTLGAIFKGKFAWKEIAPAVITFFTALFLFWRGLSDQSVKAAVASLLIVLVFTLVAVIAEKLHGRNRMNFKLRPY
jgi:drug/metabolite transporter (DMT)-like permease